MHLTPQQQATLKADVLANADTLALWNVGNMQGLADLYNLPASPVFVVWRSAVTANEIQGRPNWDWTRVDNLSVGKARIFDQMMRLGAVNPSLANVRAGIEATFTVEAADAPNRQAFYDAGSKQASRFERVYATGTGTAPTNHGVGPGLMAVEGPIDYQHFSELLTVP